MNHMAGYPMEDGTCGKHSAEEFSALRWGEVKACAFLLCINVLYQHTPFLAGSRAY